LFDFGVEEPITIVVSGVSDRAGNGPAVYSIRFNESQDPYITNQYPASNAVYIPKTTQISFDVRDAWA
jgi:hypothetical protein